jgi:hypothetical protein
MTAELDNLLTSLVRGHAVDGARLAAFDPDDFCARAAYHGVLPLVADRLARARDLPDGLARALREEARAAVAADLVRGEALRTALTALDDAGVRPLLLKGEQLAYRWYERPDLRPRLDTDLLIPSDARTLTAGVLAGLGYTTAPQVTGDLLSYQATYVQRRNGMKVHVFDVHWRVANPQVFAGLLTYEELADAAMPLPSLAPGARGLPAPAALLLACVHRVAHHSNSDRLVWLYDIHLIASSLGAAEWSRFVELVAARRVAAICAHGLERAAAAFGTTIPAAVLTDARLQAATAPEASAAYMAPGRRHMQTVADDLQALPTWRERVQLVREHLFPPARYMREVYALSSRAPLPILYATRVVRGAWRYLVRPPVNHASRMR